MNTREIVTKDKLHRMIDSMGKLKVQKSIHQFPRYSALKPTLKTSQVDVLSGALSSMQLKHISSTPYSSPNVRWRQLPASANSYFNQLVAEKLAEKARSPMLSADQALYAPRNPNQLEEGHEERADDFCEIEWEKYAIKE